MSKVIAEPTVYIVQIAGGGRSKHADRGPIRNVRLEFNGFAPARDADGGMTMISNAIEFLLPNHLKVVDVHQDSPAAPAEGKAS